MSTKYNHKELEKKWQDRWIKEKLYSPDITGPKNPFYNLWMFPYPSAEGLHAGHAFSSTGSDVLGRFMRMNGMDVFQPIGYDSFGIHSENFALKIGEHPKNMLQRTTKNYERQLKGLGHGYDWTRTVTTSDIDYYRWTQWIFLAMFKAGLAYRKKATVNWCPSCKTVLADEQVIDDVCERCKSVVEKRDLEQWFCRITDYAERLLKNLKKINWSEKIKVAQRNWIGKKEGVDIVYDVVTGSAYNIKGSKKTITCWTSRPDTNFGATFIVVAPEYPQLSVICTENKLKEVNKYIKDAQSKTKEERISQGREKTGEFTGSYAINQLTKEEMPIWISDFVLMDVGTGAVVGVPGHDKRDFEFAQKFGLPIKRVVVGADGDTSEIRALEQVQEDEGTMINSKFLNGMDIHKATQKMMDHIEACGWGKRKTHYHLRDWLVSRQRYWEAPIPVIFCKSCAEKGRSYFSSNSNKVIHKDQSDWSHAGWYPEENLPVELPYFADYQPKGTGRGPLADHPEFYKTKCPECGKEAERESDVLDTFVDSSWYFLRYPSVNRPSNGSALSTALRAVPTSVGTTTKDASLVVQVSEELPWNPEITKKWLPVDLYFGGAEHAVLHLMYSRFVTMVLHDLGYLDFEEPFIKFFAHGLMIKDGAKMSKSRGNVVNPDEYITKFGTDTLRLYLMFMGPMDGYPDFRDTGIEGMQRFTNKLWNLFQKHSKTNLSSSDPGTKSIMHRTIRKVTEDIKRYHYNTAIAAIMEYVNYLKTQKKPTQESLKTLALLIAPFTPHLAEEVWVRILGQKYSIHRAAWPSFDPELVKEDFVIIPVQINGKVRGELSFSKDELGNRKNVVEKAKRDNKVVNWLRGKEIKKEIYIDGRIINFVTD